MTHLAAVGRRRPRLALALWLVPVLVAAGLALALAPAKAAGPCDPPIANPIACENTKPGTPQSLWDVPRTYSIQGFATDISYNRGERARFKIKTSASNYTVKIFRVGYYQGNGARQIATVTPSASLPQSQPTCNYEPNAKLVDCGNWAESASWQIPSDAVSGVYFALITRTDTGADNHIVFVVRDDASTSDLLFQTADTTWQAYNRWTDQGDPNDPNENSLYTPDRAFKVSYNRPFSTRFCCSEDWLFSMEYPMIRFLEANGYDVSYTSGIDTDRRGQLIRNHKVFTAAGHDEYWSRGARENVEAARNAGVHLAMFTGNDVYWKIRWEESIGGTATPYRTLVTYKETLPNSNIDPSGQWTGTWRDPRFSPPEDGGRPENALLGNMYLVDCCAVPMKVPAADGKMRFWRNTPVAGQGSGGSMTLADNTVGYEWNVDADNGHRPPGLVRLSTTTATASETQRVDVLQDYGSRTAPGTATHHLTLYRHASGALVFGAGTIQWSWGLDHVHDNSRNQGIPNADPSMRQATVNLFGDMGVQPDTLQGALNFSDPDYSLPALIPATASTDTTPPDTAITAPAAGASIQVGQQVTITGTATDAGGGRVGGVEVSTDNGTTWHPATTGRESWSYDWTANGVGNVTIRARATDDSGRTDASPASRGVVVSCPCTIFNDDDTPTEPADGDTSAVTLGVKFRADRNGFVTGVRFYKGSGNTGTHVGTLWAAGGEVLAQATFSDETASGWQQVTFDSPVPVAANTTYVAGYHAPNGHYSHTLDGFAGADVSNPPLRALADGADGANGLYAYGASTIFPDRSMRSANYFVDVVFDTDGGPPDTTPPTVSNRAPASGANDVPTGANVTVTFNEQVTPASVNLTLRGPNNQAVLATGSYSAGSRTYTLNPDANLDADKTYTATLSHAEDLAGNAIASPVTWSFTTKGANCPCSIWDTTTVPAVAASTDASPIEVGVKFRADSDGWVTGVRFYKGAGNTGSHVGSLWNAAGTRLAVASFEGETETGWQQVTFDNPVQVSANTTYVASYHAPNGRYAFNANHFGQPAGEGPVRALANGTDGGNGVYRYTATASTFPTSSFNASNYWVDVVFAATAPPSDGNPPTVTGKVPAPGSSVAASSNVKATFNEQIQTSSLELVLRTAGGTAVPGAVSYDQVTRSASFNPEDSLVSGATYTVSVRATDLAGNAMPSPETWSFTVSAASCPCSVFNGTGTPEATAADPDPVELGMKFRPDVDGWVTGVRFFKASGNTGTHTGSLWSRTGTRLATVTFSGETASGWQEASFSSPVEVDAGTTYVISYLAPVGRYSFTRDQFASQGAGASPIRALRSGVDGANGVFLYASGGGFPVNSFRNTNYWVDVVFTTTAP